MSKKVFMIVTNRYDPDVRVHKEAMYLVSKGYEVEVLCWDRENEYLQKEFETIDQVKIKRFFPYAKYGSGLKQVKSFIKFMIETKKYLSKCDYAFLHCHDLDGVIVGLYSNKKKAKSIFDMHEMYEILGKNKKVKYIVRTIVRLFQSKCDYTVYVNEIQKKSMKNNTKRKCIYLPNYPSIQKYMAVDKYNNNKLRISYIGAVREFHTLKILMDACRELENVQVNIHGAGVAYEALSRISKEYNNVNVTGRYNINQIAEFYQHTDILFIVYPIDNIQYKLSYPVKFYEAIVTKTPVIVAKNSVLDEFLSKHDIGFAVSDDDVLELSDLIKKIEKDRKIIETKENNFNDIQYTYSWEKVVQKLDIIYNN